MSETDQQLLEGLRVDPESLYREETFTDLRVATLKRLTPIRSDGSQDPTRQVRWVGHTQIMSQMGPLPVQTEIEAGSLTEALERFPAAVKVAIDQMVQEARDMQREEMSRIVVPDADTRNKILG